MKIPVSPISLPTSAGLPHGGLTDSLSSRERHAIFQAKLSYIINAVTRYFSIATKAGWDTLADESSALRYFKISLRGRRLESANPYDFEYGPNPFIFPFSRDQPFRGPERAESGVKRLERIESLSDMEESFTGHHQSTFSSGAGLVPDQAASFSTSNIEASTVEQSNGPATKTIELSTYRCPECSEVFRKQHEVKYVSAPSTN